MARCLQDSLKEIQASNDRLSTPWVSAYQLFSWMGPMQERLEDAIRTYVDRFLGSRHRKVEQLGIQPAASNHPSRPEDHLCRHCSAGDENALLARGSNDSGHRGAIYFELDVDLCQGPTLLHVALIPLALSLCAQLPGGYYSDHRVLFQ